MDGRGEEGELIEEGKGRSLDVGGWRRRRWGSCGWFGGAPVEQEKERSGELQITGAASLGNEETRPRVRSTNNY